MATQISAFYNHFDYINKYVDTAASDIFDVFKDICISEDLVYFSADVGRPNYILKCSSVNDHVDAYGNVYDIDVEGIGCSWTVDLNDKITQMSIGHYVIDHVLSRKTHIKTDNFNDIYITDSATYKQIIDSLSTILKT